MSTLDMDASTTTGPLLDVIGVGFGPSNMALAVALEERGFRGASGLGETGEDSAPDAANPGHAPTAVFLEASAETSWHPGMLFDAASLQVSFAKDLVSFRNPTSRFTFMNFLVQAERVHDFFNRGSMAPLRVEFTAYLRWAAEQLRSFVSYGERVERVVPCLEDGQITEYAVESRTAGGEVVRRRARNVVLAAGLQPRLPENFPSAPRAFHSSTFLRRIDDVPDVSTAVVIGGGQSAAEIALEVHRRHPSAQVHLVHSRFGLIPSDATPFANRIFDNSTVDLLFDAPAGTRERLEQIHANTNNSVVHEDTLKELYDAWYVGSWTEQRLVIHDVSRVAGFERLDDDGTVRVEIVHELDGQVHSVDADLLVAGTGYRPMDPGAFLGDDARLLCRDVLGRVRASRDYALEWTVPASGRMFAVGVTQHLHGLSATLLSNIALRAGEIADALAPARVVERAG